MAEQAVREVTRRGRKTVKGNAAGPAAKGEQGQAAEVGKERCLKCGGAVRRMRRLALEGWVRSFEDRGLMEFWRCRACGTIQNLKGVEW